MTSFLVVFVYCILHICSKCCHCDYLVGLIHRGLGARFVVFGSFVGCPLCVEASVEVG